MNTDIRNTTDWSAILFKNSTGTGYIKLDQSGRRQLRGDSWHLDGPGLGATELMYTDSNPFELIAVSPSGKTLTLREMDAELAPYWRPDMVPGGFCGHTRNNASQEWVLTSNPKGRIVKVREGKRGWAHKGQRFAVGIARKFYDYNF